MLVIALAVKFFINTKKSRKEKCSKSPFPCGMQNAVLTVAALFFLVLNILLYGGNLINYGDIIPEPEKIIGVENAMENRIFARNYICQQYKDGNYTLQQAVTMTRVIKNNGDRNAALTLLRNALYYERIRPGLMDFATFTPPWFHTMLSHAVGYTGHRSLIKPKWYVYSYYWVLVIPGFFFLRKIHLVETDGIFIVAFLVTLLYSLVLWKVNYGIYIRSAMFGLAIAGRYFFPVLLPICGLTSYYTLNFLSAKKQLFLTIIVSAWFVYGDFIYFLQFVPDNWVVHSWLT